MQLSTMRTRYSRRDFLRVGGASLGGISLPQILASSQGRSEVSCLIYFHTGGSASTTRSIPSLGLLGKSAVASVRSPPRYREFASASFSAQRRQFQALLRHPVDVFAGGDSRESQAVPVLGPEAKQCIQAPCVRLGRGARAGESRRPAPVRGDPPQGHLCRRGLPGCRLRPVHRRGSLRRGLLRPRPDAADRAGPGGSPVTCPPSLGP